MKIYIVRLTLALRVLLVICPFLFEKEINVSPGDDLLTSVDTLIMLAKKKCDIVCLIKFRWLGII
jgi:hypothetical protein